MKHPSEITAEELRQWLLDQAGEIVVLRSQNTVAESLYGLCKKVDESLAVYAWHHDAVSKRTPTP